MSAGRPVLVARLDVEQLIARTPGLNVQARLELIARLDKLNCYCQGHMAEREAEADDDDSDGLPF